MKPRKAIAWPAIFNKRISLDLPAWNLGPAPTPDKPEEFQEFGRKVRAHQAECDRIKKEHLLREWWHFLGVDNSDDAMLRLGEILGIRAFQKDEEEEAKQGRPGKPLGVLIRQYVAVVEAIRSGKAKNRKEALFQLDRSLRRSRAKLKTRMNELSKIRKMYRQMGSALAE